MPSLTKPIARFLTLLLFLAGIGLHAQDRPAAVAYDNPPAGPTTTIEFKKTTINFGLIEQGTIVQRVFTFKNTGDEPLVISAARGSCGCTVPEWPKGPIAPGETASLTVEFNSNNKLGKRNQKVTITANTSPPQTFLYLTGEIEVREEEDNLEGIEISEEIADPVISPDCFAIFPNPTAEVLKLDIEEEWFGEAASVSIFSETGQLMAQRDVQAVDTIIEFNVSHYPPGTYVANVQVGDRRPEAKCFVVVE